MGRTLFLLVLVLILPRLANACGCHNSATVLDNYEHADFVIVAQLKGLTKGRSRFGSDISHATMVVQKVFKGDVKIGQDLTFGNGEPVLGCSWQFYPDWVGQTYLLYLYRPEKPSEPFYVSTCDRSTSVESAHEDLLYLEKMDKLRGRTRLSGYVEREGADYENVKGQQVRIVGRNKTYIATTDEKGLYELYDLPPGRYSVEPVFQRGWMVDAWGLTRQPTRAELMNSDSDGPVANKIWFTLRPKRHFGVYIRLRLNNKITGRVTTHTGQPLNRVCVSLETVNTKPSVCQAFTDTDGRFEITSVDAGSYNLVVNYAGIRSSYQPFLPTLYYPGVTTPEAAKVLEVKFAQSIRDLNFVVPSSSETVKFEGTVRYANGRPASNRFVGFVASKTAEFGGSVQTLTDDQGRFSLPVLKGLRGELYSSYPPNDREFNLCPDMKRIIQQTGKPVIETERVSVEATENKTFELKLPISPCQ